MNCHICGKPAVGQCQRCSRFYCKDHERHVWAKPRPYCSECAALRLKRLKVSAGMFVGGMVAGLLSGLFIEMGERISPGFENLGCGLFAITIGLWIGAVIVAGTT